jgi:hypothetical protein
MIRRWGPTVPRRSGCLSRLPITRLSDWRTSAPRSSPRRRCRRHSPPPPLRNRVFTACCGLLGGRAPKAPWARFAQNVHACAHPFIGHLLDIKPSHQNKLLISLALPRGASEPNEINHLRQGLGETSPIESRCLSGRPPKPMALRTSWRAKTPAICGAGSSFREVNHQVPGGQSAGAAFS